MGAGGPRVLRIVLVLLGLTVAGLSAVAWFAGDAADLELHYEGFD
jgi:hypothetical protein